MHQIHPAIPLDNWLKEKHGRFQGEVLGSTLNHQQQNNQRSKDLLSYDTLKIQERAVFLRFAVFRHFCIHIHGSSSVTDDTGKLCLLKLQAFNLKRIFYGSIIFKHRVTDMT